MDPHSPAASADKDSSGAPCGRLEKWRIKYKSEGREGLRPPKREARKRGQDFLEYLDKSFPLHLPAIPNK
jgi:hypothetical protein